MIVASVVLPSPGGPTSRTWSSASPRALRGLERDLELLLRPLLADELVESARPQRLLDLLVALAGAPGARNWLRHAALRRAPRGRAPRRAGSGSTPASACSASTTRVAELDERVARDELARSAALARPAIARRRSSLSSSSTMRSAVFLPMPGIAWKRAVSLERDRALELGRRRARHDRERDLRPDPADPEELHEELALGRVGEPVELQRVLADVQVRLDGHLAPRRPPCAARSASR